MIKRILFSVALVLLNASVFCQYVAEGGPQFRNYDFEEWELFDPNDERSLEPSYWHAWMSAYGEYNPLQNAKYQQIFQSNHLRPGTEGNTSVKIIARDALGLITANGGITNGRIHVGSTSVADPSNFNITLREQETFNTHLGAFPDSLTIWVAFVCEYPNQYARVRAIVHGDVDFSERADGSLEPMDMYCGQALSIFPRTNNINDTLNYNWMRLSIPFTYDGACQNPEYVLFTLGTNQYPGQGLGNEYVLFDDVLMIYNPSLSLGNFNVSRIALQDEDVSIDIPYIIEGTMSPSNLNLAPNVVMAQLSDKDGNFENAVELGRVVSNESGVIEGIVPAGIPYGDGYRIRLTSTNYPLISEDNGNDIVIDSTLNIAEYNADIKVYPTVVENIMIVEAACSIDRITVFSANGTIVKLHDNDDSNVVKMDLRDLRDGLYLVEVCSSSKKIVSKVLKKYK